MRRDSKKNIVRAAAGVLAAVGIFSNLLCVQAAEAPAGSAVSYLLVNVETGEVIAEKGASEDAYAGNYTSLMVAMVALDMGVDPDAPIAFSEETVARIEALGTLEYTAENRRLSPEEQAGEVISVREMMYGMTMGPSAACAYQLAQTLTNGDEAAFLERMNEKAQQLGAVGTVYTDVAGRDDNTELSAVTNACDMMTVFVNAIGYDEIRAMLENPDAVIAGNAQSTERTLTASNPFVAGTAQLDGVLYGFRAVDESNHTVAMVTLTERNGIRLIAVTIGSGEAGVVSDAASLINYGYDYLAGECTLYEYSQIGEVSMQLREDAPLYAVDTDGAEVLTTLAAGTVCQVDGVWEDWYRVTVPALTEEGAEESTAGYLKGDVLEALQEQPEDDKAEDGQEQPSGMQETAGIENGTGTLDEGAYSAVLAAQIKQRQRQKTYTYVALAAAFLSAIGLMVLNRK